LAWRSIPWSFIRTHCGRVRIAIGPERRVSLRGRLSRRSMLSGYGAVDNRTSWVPAYCGRSTSRADWPSGSHRSPNGRLVTAGCALRRNTRTGSFGLGSACVNNAVGSIVQTVELLVGALRRKSVDVPVRCANGVVLHAAGVQKLAGGSVWVERRNIGSEYFAKRHAPIRSLKLRATALDRLTSAQAPFCIVTGAGPDRIREGTFGAPDLIYIICARPLSPSEFPALSWLAKT